MTTSSDLNRPLVAGPARPVAGVTAIDIETDTTPCHEPRQECCSRRGLDPTITSITAVAIADVNGEVVLDAVKLGGEAALLLQLENILSTRTGLLATWNGAVFDLPFIADRAETLGVALSLHITPAEWVHVKYQPLPGHGGGYVGSWGGMQHVDVMTWYQEAAVAHNVSWSLKPVATLYGLEPVSVDRTAMHTLTTSQLEAYVASDARVTRELALMALNENTQTV